MVIAYCIVIGDGHFPFLVLFLVDIKQGVESGSLRSLPGLGCTRAGFGLWGWERVMHHCFGNGGSLSKLGWQRRKSELLGGNTGGYYNSGMACLCRSQVKHRGFSQNVQESQVIRGGPAREAKMA
jgi:hypothetical protein